MDIVLIAGYAAAVGLIAAYAWAACSSSPTVVRIALLAGALSALVRLGTAVYLWTLGWPTVADIITVAVPLLLAAVVLAPPVRTPSRWRRHTALAAAAGHGYATFVVQPPPYLPRLAILWALLAAVGAIAWWSSHEPASQVRLSAIAAAVVATMLIGATGVSAWANSRIPAAASMADHSTVDLGGGNPPAHAGHPGHSQIDVATLTSPTDRMPDRRYTLTAQTARIRLASGEQVTAWTFNGAIPGPPIAVHVGELVEITLINRDVAAGVTVHWHGLDVPNAEDGVAGLTQDAVAPGQQHVYRFVPHQTGTFWYHSHQHSNEQVRHGLFGALIVKPPAGSPRAATDLAVIAHAYPGGDGPISTLSVDAALPSSAVTRYAAKPGSPVRLRLINADNQARTFSLDGAPFRVVAIDGTDLHQPADLTHTQVLIAGGGRYDLAFTMPSGAVQLAITADENGTGHPALLLSPDDNAELQPTSSGPVLDPIRYGTPTATPFGAGSHFDRQFTLVLGQGFGWFNGTPTLLRTINGTVYPNTPSLLVSEGDLVKVTFINRSFSEHPMHLHGHHMLVLSHNGTASSGSPWWTDTLHLDPGDSYEVAFRADNPGLWMDHCHNLQHAADGMTMHLMYDGYTTSTKSGAATGNQPEGHQRPTIARRRGLQVALRR
jgi:FtsP/CotA-like multicopper oxidase with cupredoxin domain